MKNDTYMNESQKLASYKDFCSGESKTLAQYKNSFNELVSDYSELLVQTKLITKIGDRLQKSEKEKNDELEATIEELVRAKIGRKATTIVFILAIAIFFVVEVFIEPIIEQHTDFYYGIIIKLVLVLSIKPLEMSLEHSLLNRAKRRSVLSS